MKKITHLSDLTDLTNQEIQDAYKRYEPAIKMLRLTEINFWIISVIIGVVGFLYFMENKLGDYQSFFLLLIVVSSYYIGERIAYKKGFHDWYEWWWSDGIKRAIKFERSLSDEEFTTMEEMDFESKHWS